MKHVGGGGAFSRVPLLPVFGHCGGGEILGILSLDERERERLGMLMLASWQDEYAVLHRAVVDSG